MVSLGTSTNNLKWNIWFQSWTSLFRVFRDTKCCRSGNQPRRATVCSMRPWWGFFSSECEWLQCRNGTHTKFQRVDGECHLHPIDPIYIHYDIRTRRPRVTPAQTNFVSFFRSYVTTRQSSMRSSSSSAAFWLSPVAAAAAAAAATTKWGGVSS